MRKLVPVAGIAFALAVVSLFWWKACSDHAASTKAAATERASEPQRAKGPGDAATFGLTTEVKGDVLEVTNVKEGGPAAQVGVQVGDKITALEGQPVKQLGAELAHKLLMSGSPSVGQTVKLTLERGPTVAVTAIKW